MILLSPVTNTSTPNQQQDKKGPVLDVLRELLGEGRNDEVLLVVSKLLERNKELELLVDKMRAAKNRGEQVSSAQLDLFLEKLREQSVGELQQANEDLEQAVLDNGGRPYRPDPPKQPPVRRPAPPGLRRVDNPIAVPDAERPCPVCGSERKCIGHESTEVIDLIPAEVIVRIDQREVLACEVCDAEMVRAPMGDKVVSGGVYGSQLVAELVVGKYWDGLPLNRQREQLERLGLSMPSSSMSDQIMWATDLLRPVWTQLIAAVLGAAVLHVDGTSLLVKDKDSPKGIVVGSLWGYVGDTDKAVYLYTTTGKKLGQATGDIGPEQFLAARQGPIVADAANLFDKTFQSPDRFEVGCNMHGRRYFVKALEANDVRAAVPIAAFKALYDVEDTTREMDAEGRLAERQARSRPVYDELLKWCRKYYESEPPSSLLAKAIKYVLNQEVALTRFLDDGGLPIDNGIVERLHRRPAIGRRSYLFAGSHAAGHRAAIAYSVLATCSLVGVNPAEYLADILPKLARGTFTTAEITPMLPAAWKTAHAL